jgi:hypothetical protein
VKLATGRTDLHAVRVACLHALVHGVVVGRNALLELRLHLRGARVSVVPGTEPALSCDTD